MTLDLEKAKVVESVRKQLGPGIVVCIVGSSEIADSPIREIVEALAREVSSKLGTKVTFLTGGMTGVQETFAKHCSDGARIWNMLPMGQTSNYGIGTDINVGANLDERKEIFAHVGDFFICVGGGPGATYEAGIAFGRGVGILPLIRSGGASSGEFDFPAEALKKPTFATEEQWALLGRTDVPIAESVAAAATIAGRFVELQRAREKDHAVAEVRKLLKGKVCICILGGTAFKNPASEELVKLLAGELHQALGVQAAYVTGGMDGIQETFAKHCGDGSLVWNLMHLGQSSGYGVGKDINFGADLDHRKEIFAALGDIYITVEGGPGVSFEARGAFSRGAFVLPLIRTGGASAGMFDFPAAAMKKPEFVREQEWASLNNSEAPVSQTSRAVVDIVLSSMRQLRLSRNKEVYVHAKSQVLDALRTLDSSGNGEIQEMQWAAFTRCACPTLTQKECQLLLAASGAGRNRRVAYQEVVDWIFAS